MDTLSVILPHEHIVDLGWILGGVEEIQGGDAGGGKKDAAVDLLKEWHGGGVVFLEHEQKPHRQIGQDPGHGEGKHGGEEPEPPPDQGVKDCREVVDQKEGGSDGGEPPDGFEPPAYPGDHTGLQPHLEQKPGKEGASHRHQVAQLGHGDGAELKPPLDLGQKKKEGLLGGGHPPHLGDVDDDPEEHHRGGNAGAEKEHRKGVPPPQSHKGRGGGAEEQHKEEHRVSPPFSGNPTKAPESHRSDFRAPALVRVFELGKIYLALE